MVGMKGGLTDGENCRETFRDRNDSAFDRRWRAGTKASDGNENAKAAGYIWCGYGKGDKWEDIKDSVGSCNKHGKSSKETGRTK